MQEWRTPAPIPTTPGGVFETVLEYETAGRLRDALASGRHLAAYLIPETGNQHDPNAIRVDASDGTEVWKAGYLPAGSGWRHQVLRMWQAGWVPAGAAVAFKPDASSWEVELRVRVIDQPLFTQPVLLDRRHA